MNISVLTRCSFLIALALCACSGGRAGTSSPAIPGVNPTPAPPNGRPPFNVVVQSTTAPRTFQSPSFSAPGTNPIGITAADGYLFVADTAVYTGGANDVALLDYQGAAYRASVPTGHHPIFVTKGIDGRVWFSTASQYVGAATFSTNGTYNQAIEYNDFGIPSANATTNGVLSDPNGVIWFTEPSNDSIVRMTTWGSLLSRTGTAQGIPVGAYPWHMAVGPDHQSVWVTFYGSTGSGVSAIGKFDLNGNLVATYNLNQSTCGYRPAYITAATDGNLYFTEQPNVLRPSGQVTAAVSTYVVQIAPATGTMTCYLVPSSGYDAQIVEGPDKNIWFTEYQNGNLAVLTLSNKVITEYALPDKASTPGPDGLTVGEDGQLWMTEINVNKITAFHP